MQQRARLQNELPNFDFRQSKKYFSSPDRLWDLVSITGRNTEFSQPPRPDRLWDVI